MELKGEKSLYMLNFKNLPKGLLFAISIIFFFEFFNAYFDNYFYDFKAKKGRLAGFTINVKNGIARSNENNFDIIILGESHSHFGFIPQLIKDKTGLSCFNFSLFGPQEIIGSYMIFKNYVQSHSIKPKYVIIGTETLYTFPITKSSYSKDAITNLIDLREGNVIMFIKEFGIIKGAKFFLPSLKHQNRFKNFFKDPFSFDIPDKAEIDHEIEQIYLNKGFILNTKSVNKERKINEYKIFFKEHDQVLNNFKISPFSYKYLKGILELAKKNKIRPILYIPAMPPYVYDGLKEYKVLEELDKFFDFLKQDYEDLVVLKSQQILNEDDIFLDITHLSKEGAIKLSNFMAQKIIELEGK